MRDKFLGLNINLDDSVATGTIIFRPSDEFLVRQMRKRGWSIDFEMKSVKTDDHGTVATAFEANLFKHGVPMLKPEWDDELAEVMRENSATIVNLSASPLSESENHLR